MIWGCSSLSSTVLSVECRALLATNMSTSMNLHAYACICMHVYEYELNIYLYKCMYMI